MAPFKATQKVMDLKSEPGALIERTKFTIPVLSLLASTGLRAVHTVTFPAASGASQGHYVVLSNAAGDTVAVWLDLNAAGTAPTGAAYVAAAANAKVSLTTGMTAAQIAANAKAKIIAGGDLDNVTITDNGDGSLTFKQDLVGTTTAPAVHNADDSGVGSITKATVQASVAPVLQNKYVLFSHPTGPTNFYAWLNFDGAGVDPAVSSRTGIEVACTSEMSASELAAAMAVAIDANANFLARSAGRELQVDSSVSGNSVNATAGNSGFAVEIEIDGHVANSKNLASQAVTGLSNEPDTVAAHT